MLLRFKELLEKILLKKQIESSMALQFVVALAGIISVLMVLGSLFVAQVLMDRQYRSLEVRGRETGLFLGKAGVDALQRGDFVALDALVAEAVTSQDVLYLYITDGATNKAVTDRLVSFNRSDPKVRSLLDDHAAADVAGLAGLFRKEFDVLDVQAPIKTGGSRVGTVTIGFSKEPVKREARNSMWLLLGTSIAIIAALSALVYRMVQRMIVLPTREAVLVASNIASGDLTQSVRVRSVDELGMLGRGLNRMIIGLKSMVERIQEAAHGTDAVWTEVKKTSDEISSGSRVQFESVEEAASSVNEMHFSIKEIGSTVEELHGTSEKTSFSVTELAGSITTVADTMADLSLSIEETSKAITKMSSAISQIAENVDSLSSAAAETSATTAQISRSVKEVESAARESASLAEAVASDAQEVGMKAIEKTVEGMGRIESNARRSAEVVNRLGQRAESIGSILTVIEEITDQTSLLALNAAILAAQAGDQGKGFSVVAAEIRELANRTAASTHEISTLIVSVQEEARQAVETMHEGNSIVAEGVRVVGNAGDALRKILERAGTSRDMSRSINRAAAEQASGIRQVSEAVRQIDTMAHQFALATNEQKIGSEQISRAAEKMREITRTVKAALEEQARSGMDIAASVQRMNEKVGMVNRGTDEVQAGSDMIVASIDRIKEIAKVNVDLAAGLNRANDVMSQQSAALNKQIEKFKTGGR
jgi:methyl-accepting chemotaxis protein